MAAETEAQAGRMSQSNDQEQKEEMRALHELINIAGSEVPQIR